MKPASENRLEYILILIVILLVIAVAIAGVIIFKGARPAPPVAISPLPSITLPPTPAPLLASTLPPQEKAKASATATQTRVPLVIIPFAPSDTSTPVLPSPTPDYCASLPKNWWMKMPVVPDVSPNVLVIYKAGLAMGNNPAHFSKVGDCQNIRQYFLGNFDDPIAYDIGPYDYLNLTIAQFQGALTASAWR